MTSQASSGSCAGFLQGKEGNDDIKRNKNFSVLPRGGDQWPQYFSTTRSREVRALSVGYQVGVFRTQDVDSLRVEELLAFVSLPPLAQASFVMVEKEGGFACLHVLPVRPLDAAEQGSLDP